MKTITVVATIESLNNVIDFVKTELGQNNCPPEPLDQIELAVEEVFTNIVNYAYPASCGTASISIDIAEEVWIRFEDTGVPYNPLEHPDPDLDKPLMEREIGGLGVFLVKQMMDKVDYIRSGDKNVFTMTKNIGN